MVPDKYTMATPEDLLDFELKWSGTQKIITCCFSVPTVANHTQLHPTDKTVCLAL